MSLRTFALLYGRTMRQFPRIPTVLVFGLAMPVIQILLFGSIFSQTTELQGHPYQGENYYAFITPAIILLTAFLGMANSSAAFLVDLRTGYFDKLRTTPASAPHVIGARLCAEMTRVSGQCVLVLLISFALGAAVATGVAGAALLIAAAVFFSACTTGLVVLALAMKTRSDQATQSAFPLFFVLIFVSTAYMPKNLLPGWLQSAVAFNPVDYLIRGLRSLMFDGWSQALPEIGIGLGLGFGIGLLLVSVNMRIYRRLVD